MTTTDTHRPTRADLILDGLAEHTGTWAAGFDRLLSVAVDALLDAHQPAHCEAAEDCPACPHLSMLVDLVTAYRHHHGIESTDPAGVSA